MALPTGLVTSHAAFSLGAMSLRPSSMTVICSLPTSHLQDIANLAHLSSDLWWCTRGPHPTRTWREQGVLMLSEALG